MSKDELTTTTVVAAQPGYEVLAPKSRATTHQLGAVVMLDSPQPPITALDIDNAVATNSVVPALELPAGVTITATALACSRELTIREWNALGRSLARVETSINWWIGDWWALGTHAYGARKAMVNARKVFDRGYAFGTLMNIGSVASRVATSRRRETLTFSHHVEVAALEAEEQTRWLNLAVEKKLSVKALRRRIVEASLERFIGFTEAEKIQAFLRRLEKAAQIPKFITFPWERSDVEIYLKERIARTDFSQPSDYDDFIQVIENAAAFWSRTAAFVRRIEADARQADPAVTMVEAA